MMATMTVVAPAGRALLALLGRRYPQEWHKEWRFGGGFGELLGHRLQPDLKIFELHLVAVAHRNQVATRAIYAFPGFGWFCLVQVVFSPGVSLPVFAKARSRSSFHPFGA